MADSECVERNSEYEEEEFSDYEKVYLRMSRAFNHLGKEHWGIHCICSIQCDEFARTDIEVRMRNAWMQLVIEYPGLSMIANGFHKQYSRLDKANTSRFADNTFFIECEVTAENVVAEAEPRELPALYYLPRSSEIILLTQHWRTDGMGVCMLLDRLFEIMEAPIQTLMSRVEIEHNLLSPSMETAAGAEEVADSEIQQYARGYVERFHQRAVNGLGLRFHGGATTEPSHTAHCDKTLSADSTNAIKAACKASLISVTAAIHVALAQTVFSFLPEAECQTGYTTVMAVNMRHHLPTPYNTRAHACQTYVASIIPTVPYNSEFVEAARTLTHEYQNWWSEKFMRSLRWIYKYNLEFLSAPRAVGAAPQKPPSGVTLSSLGVVERHLRGDYGPHLKIEKFRFGVSMMTRQMILYAWTFRDQLTVSLNYNKAYYSDSEVSDILSRLEANLAGGLEVELGTAR